MPTRRTGLTPTTLTITGITGMPIGSTAHTGVTPRLTPADLFGARVLASTSGSAAAGDPVSGNVISKRGCRGHRRDTSFLRRDRADDRGHRLVGADELVAKPVAEGELDRLPDLL